MSKFQFVNDYKGVAIKDGDVVSYIPTELLSEEDKEYIYQEKAKEGYA